MSLIYAVTESIQWVHIFFVLALLNFSFSIIGIALIVKGERRRAVRSAVFGVVAKKVPFSPEIIESRFARQLASLIEQSKMEDVANLDIEVFAARHFVDRSFMNRLTESLSREFGGAPPVDVEVIASACRAIDLWKKDPKKFVEPMNSYIAEVSISGRRAEQVVKFLGRRQHYFQSSMDNFVADVKQAVTSAYSIQCAVKRA